MNKIIHSIIFIVTVICWGDVLIGQVLNVPQVIQEQDQWCWAAVSSSILQYYGHDIDQCTIAEYTRENATWHNFGVVDCCTDPNQGCNYWNYNWGYTGSIQDILQHWGVNNYGYVPYLTITQIQNEINGGRPYIMRWGWTSGGGHFLVGYGIESSTLYYMNPWFGEGYELADYSWVVSASDHEWTHTNILTTTPPPPSVVLDFPPDSGVIFANDVSFKWRAYDLAWYYELQVAHDANFTNLVIDTTYLFDTVCTITNLPAGNQYSWRVRSTNNFGDGGWSIPRTFSSAHIVNYTFDAGWNIISLPLNVPDRRKTTLFPSAMSDGFRYTGGVYTTADTLFKGIGYWLRFSGDQNLAITGLEFAEDSIPVVEGWNMIGSISEIISSHLVTPDSLILSPFFGYKNGYYIADTLFPARGYWVKIQKSGILLLDTNNVTVQAKISSSSAVQWNKLFFSVAEGDSRELFFGTGRSNINLGRYQLPPSPPQGAFDVRFRTGNFAAFLDETISGDMPIDISSPQYPVTATWEFKNNIRDVQLKIADKSIAMLPGGSVMIANAGTPISIQWGNTASVPIEFALLQNYPNPFNPTTTISYELPVESFVNIKVMNLLGDVVQVLTGDVQNPGYKTVDWNAANFASGVYICRLEAIPLTDPGKSFTDVRKMILMK